MLYRVYKHFLMLSLLSHIGYRYPNFTIYKGSNKKQFEILVEISLLWPPELKKGFLQNGCLSVQLCTHPLRENYSIELRQIRNTVIDSLRLQNTVLRRVSEAAGRRLAWERGRWSYS